MINKTMRTLEFTKVIESVQTYAQTNLGKESIGNIVPLSDYDEIVRLQEETDEALTLVRLHGSPPFGGVSDVIGTVKRSQIGGICSGPECRGVADTIYGTKNVQAYFQNHNNPIPYLEKYGDELIALPSLERNLNGAVDDQGNIVDDASPTLKGIRNQIRGIEARVREQLEGMIRNSNIQKMLSDVLVTIRNNRYVLPVKAEHRSAFGGLVHDESSSGATLFIEPERVVILNNERSALKIKEQTEIEKILRALSEEIAAHGNEIIQNVKILTELDCIFAKAGYSRSNKCSKPIINKEGKIYLKQVRHPLIGRNEVVSNDLFMGEYTSAVVITGPNTGGKTVLLKTLGLCVLMMQSGLHIPAAEGSTLSIFEHILADIGDEQSIEQSLSTFSSHMVNIVKVMEIANHESLVLFDELGAGTDPQEGAALAIAILDEMKRRGTKVLATTHYAELKAYAFQTDGIENASMEFNVSTLQPTYRLQIGTPGKSNAFEISKRLGLSDQVLDVARKQLSEEANQVETMIISLQASEQRARMHEMKAAQIQKEAEEARAKLEKELELIEEKRNSVMTLAQKEVDQKLQKAQEEAEQIIRELRLLQRKGAEFVKEHELIDAKAKLKEAAPTFKTKGKQPKKAKEAFEIGDEVKVISFNQKGHLVEKANDSEWFVQLGIMKIKAKIEDLQKIKSEVVKPVRNVTTVKTASSTVTTQLDLRGERYEEAMHRLEKFVDDALMSNYPRATIIHGHGTGALRKGVQDYLKSHRRVKSYRLGGQGEGGLGVTVIELN